jgi:hypothetical protein
MEDNDENRSDTYLDELLRRINPNARLDKDVHEALMEVIYLINIKIRFNQ